MNAPWTAIPRAAALLADCAANPPVRATWRTRGGDRNHNHFSPRDARVRELLSIHRGEAERLLKLADQSGDYAAHRAHCLLSVQDAIEAVAAHNLEEAA